MAAPPALPPTAAELAADTPAPASGQVPPATTATAGAPRPPDPQPPEPSAAVLAGPDLSGRSQQRPDARLGGERDARAAAGAPAGPSEAGAPDVATAAQGVSAPALARPEPAPPADVVAQVARQADLYRLPGGQGVRIQLQPEGLGSVDVTVRYGPGRTVELHLAVESTATGALLQAGWGDLRDALLAQGFSTDRLVLSVVAPSPADASGTQGGQTGARADPGATGFGQQPGGRQGGGERPAHTTPGAPTEPPGPTAEEPHPGAGPTARIDYRV